MPPSSFLEGTHPLNLGLAQPSKSGVPVLHQTFCPWGSNADDYSDSRWVLQAGRRDCGTQPDDQLQPQCVVGLICC